MQRVSPERCSELSERSICAIFDLGHVPCIKHNKNLGEGRESASSATLCNLSGKYSFKVIDYGDKCRAKAHLDLGDPNNSLTRQRRPKMGELVPPMYI